MAQVLHGVRVVEHGTFITGPAASMLLDEPSLGLAPLIVAEGPAAELLDRPEIRSAYLGIEG